MSIEATLELRRQAHEVADGLGREHILWRYYASIAEGLDDLVDGNPDPWDCVPFTIYKACEDNDDFDAVLVKRFRNEWAKDIAWASVEITGRADAMTKALRDNEEV